jgi:hypothetical protein
LPLAYSKTNKKKLAIQLQTCNYFFTKVINVGSYLQIQTSTA